MCTCFRITQLERERIPGYRHFVTHDKGAASDDQQLCRQGKRETSPGQIANVRKFVIDLV
jgi:hypothetical protein